MHKELMLDGILMSAMRSGSTWLAMLCNRHPDIFLCPGQKIKTTKESGIEQIDWKGYSGEKFRLGRRNLKIKEFYLDAYYKHNRNMKFICLLREPISRTYSHYIFLCQKKRKKREGIKPISSSFTKIEFDFNKAVLEGLKRKQKPKFIQKSLYYQCLMPYLRTFGEKNFLIMSFEKATADPNLLFKKISELIDIQNVVPTGAHRCINKSSLNSRRVIHRKIEVSQPSNETKSILREIFVPDIKKLDNTLGLSLVNEWL